MKSPLLFFLGLFIGFGLDVRVKAESSSGFGSQHVQLRNITLKAGVRLRGRILQQPVGCLDDSSVNCAFEVGRGERLEVKAKTGEWMAAEGAVVIINGAGWTEVRLVEGMMRLRREGPAPVSAVVTTEFGQVYFPPAMAGVEVYLEKSKSGLRLINVGDSSVAIARRSAGHELNPALHLSETLMAGAEVELGLPSLRSGSVESGLPVPFHFDDQVVREARFFSGTKSDFRTRVEGLAEKRNQAAAVLAPLHEAMAKRTIAMIKHQKEESARARERRELRDRELRTLFRKRVLGVQ